MFVIKYFVLLYLLCTCYAYAEEIFFREEYDYIVVGLGAAGSIIASRLAESGQYKVLGVEVGKRTHRSLNGTDYVAASYYLDQNGDIQVGTPFTRFDVPAFTGSTFNNPTPYDRYTLINNGRTIESWAAKLLGGSGAHNGMLFSRFTKDNFDSWNVNGWTYKDVLPFYKKLENVTGTQSAINPSYHGFSGPIKISDTPTNQYYAAIDPWVQSCVNTGLPRNVDFNGPKREGCGTQVFNIRNGVRDSSAHAYLSKAARKGNLFLALESTVSRILIEKNWLGRPRAVGVEYIKGGVKKRVYARKEVVLSAGALNTPRIMQLSGIGPKNLLESLGIQVHVANDNVGKNLRNNQIAIALWTYPSANIPSAWNTSPISSEYALYQTGVWSFPAVFGYAYACSKTGVPCTDPDVMVGSANGLPYVANGIPTETLQLLVEPAAPLSTGSLKIRSTDPFDPIYIDFPVYQNAADLNSTIAGLQLLRRIRETYPANNSFVSEILPGPAVQTYQDYVNYVNSTGQLVAHWIGTTKMGNNGDPTAVVDTRLRVLGIDRLRVGDTSPLVRMSSHTHATALMMGERTAHLILEDA